MIRSPYPAYRLTTVLPLVLLPVLAIILVNDAENIPSFVNGLVTGVAVALLVAYGVMMGVSIRQQLRDGERRKLDDLEPLSGLERTDTAEDER